jgi:hypothetical protein
MDKNKGVFMRKLLVIAIAVTSLNCLGRDFTPEELVLKECVTRATVEFHEDIDYYPEGLVMRTILLARDIKWCRVRFDRTIGNPVADD